MYLLLNALDNQSGYGHVMTATSFLNMNTSLMTKQYLWVSKLQYGRLARKKRPVYCPYCKSFDVHPMGRAVQEKWVWECKDCKKHSLYGYKLDESFGIRGVTLYPPHNEEDVLPCTQE